MAIKHFPVVRFTSRGREYEVDERLITTIDRPHQGIRMGIVRPTPGLKPMRHLRA